MSACQFEPLLISIPGTPSPNQRQMAGQAVLLMRSEIKYTSAPEETEKAGKQTVSAERVSASARESLQSLQEIAARLPHNWNDNCRLLRFTEQRCSSLYADGVLATLSDQTRRIIMTLSSNLLHEFSFNSGVCCLSRGNKKNPPSLCKRKVPRFQKVLSEPILLQNQKREGCRIYL